jgi:O-methyltransferase
MGMPTIPERLQVNIRRCLASGRRKFALLPANDLASAVAKMIAALDESRRAECQLINYRPPSSSLSEQFGHSATLDAVAHWQPDVLVICEDRDKFYFLSSLNRATWITYPEVLTYGSGHTELKQLEAEELERQTGEPSHAVGYRFAKANIWELLSHYAKAGKRGTILELGVFRGGTLLLIAAMLRALQVKGNRIIGFDTWSGFPKAKTLLDMYSDEAFVYRDFEEIALRLGSHGIELVRGDVSETISSLPSHQSLLLTFIDTDNYTPVKHALPFIAQRTAIGGAIVFDHYFALEEYNDALGEGVAAAEFFASRSDFINLSGTGVFLKMPSA